MKKLRERISTMFMAVIVIFVFNLTALSVTAATPGAANGTPSVLWFKKFSQSWSFSATPPVLAENSIYVVADGCVLKIDPKSGAVKARSAKLDGTASFAVNPPAYDNGKIFVQIGNGRVQALDADTLEPLWVSYGEIGGQTISPISCHNGLIFTGTWSGDETDGDFFCLAQEGSGEVMRKWSVSHNGGFYFSGAYCTNDYVIFGSDDGTRESSAGAMLFCVNSETGEIIDTVEEIIGDIRTTPTYDETGSSIYFMTNSGLLYAVELNSDGTFNKNHIKTAKIAEGGTAPVVISGDVALVGATDGNGTGFYAAVDISGEEMKIIGRTELPGYPQTAPIADKKMEADGIVKLYTTYNAYPGGIVEVEFKKSEGKTEMNTREIFTPTEKMSQYCICPPICDDDGVMYYKNDSGYLMAVGSGRTQYFSDILGIGGKWFSAQ